MWGGVAANNNMGAVYGPGGVGTTTTTAQKHDIFVGNLSFNTSEEQLHVAFSEIGRVINVRMVLDQEGKSKGYAFVEFEDPQAALSAIRNMNEYELNGRKLRVNFSNSSHLESLAEKMGMDLSSNKNIATSKESRSKPTDSGQSSTQAVADALKSFSKAEMYDVIKQFKDISDRDPDEARRVISSHPQLPEALLFLMSKLEMIKNPLPTEATTAAVAGTVPILATTAPPVVARPADPRAAPPRTDPRQQQQPIPPRMDPRQQAQPQLPPPPRADPRAAVRAPPLQQPPYGQQQQPPQPMGYTPQPPPPPGVANIDPGLVQQVMSLTPQQISQLPPDKQQSILQLRQQIANSR